MTTLARGLAGITVISACKAYRYCLWRDADLNGKGTVVFVGLNPSTADAKTDDPTIRRCIGFAKSWGFGKLCMVNLFAMRATRPADMLKAGAPIGSINDLFLRELCRTADLVVACWGNNGIHMGRDQAAAKLIGRAKCLGKNKSGQPKHPLYVANKTKLIRH